MISRALLHRTGAVLAGALALFCLAASGTRAEDTGGRFRMRLDADWRFLRDPAPKTAGGDFKWTWKAAAAGTNLDITALPAGLGDSGWKDTAVGQDVFGGRRAFAWYRTTLGPISGKGERVLHFESVDDNAVVFLNGRKLAVHHLWNEPFDVVVDPAWKEGGPNVLTLLVENTDGPGGVSGPVSLAMREPEVAPAMVRPDYDDHAWRTVHLPHDYVVEEPFDQKADTSHGSLPVYPAWYRKRFLLPKSFAGKSIWIDFDGVYRNATVYLNGKLLGNHPSGYMGFRHDITRDVKIGQGENVLAVRVDPRHPEGWWYEGGGIYRHVWLNATDPVHVQPWGTYVRSTVRGSEGEDHPQADVSVETTVTNDSPSDQECRIQWRIIAPSGRSVGTLQSQLSLPAGQSRPVTVSTELPMADLWSIETPNLYHLRTSIIREGGVVDRTETTFGVRTIRFDADRGFFLNGKPVKLKGTCNHQDHAGVGIAIPDSLFEWRVKLLQEMGSNAYRCSHNPPAEELLDACDRLGMVVMDETRHLGDTTLAKTPAGTPASDLSEFKAMLLRDRNHPSIIMWSLFNEEPLQGTPDGARIFSAMKEVTRQLDSTRPVTGAMNGGWGFGISLVQDLQGFNYGIGGYEGYHQRFPKQPVYGSETASAVSTRGIYANDPVRGYVSAYDVNRPPWGATAEAAWKPIGERPWMAGAFVWTGFDYKGEPTPYGWPCINSHFGIMDICGFAKDSYYYYKAWWGDKPSIHLLPHWNWKGQEGKPINVWCHSNAQRVELFLNGKSLGSKDMPRLGHLEWSVPYAPGTLEARGYNGGEVVATTKVETTGPPVSIRLRAPARSRLIWDGEDVVSVSVEVLDAAGRTVPTADNLIQFEVENGSVAGVGNGDPSSHEPDKASQRRAFNGRCLALVRAGGSGPVTLRAKAQGLRTGTVRIYASGG